MRIVTPAEVAGQTQNKYLGVLVAAKFARFVNDFPRDRSVDWEEKLTTRAFDELVLGVSGGIACYKSCFLARRLTEAGATVDVVLTAAAAEFVRPLTFEALTGRPVLTSLWERGRALAHIDLAKDPDLVIVAPATANILARAAMGMADDLLTALLLGAHHSTSKWSGKRVVVTAGATREHLDPVRVITNPSSGRMGYALAEAARARGAN